MRGPSGAPGSRGAPSLPLWVVLACEDNPKVCTGRKLLHLELARELTGGRRPPRGAVLLDPHAPRPLFGPTAAEEGRRGLVAVDCSWNRLGQRGELPESTPALARGLLRRRLPFLLAANPQHYGRLGELNTAEALGAAVYLSFGAAPAEAYFSRLAGGTGFLELNRAPLQEYERAADATEVSEIERRYFG